MELDEPHLFPPSLNLASKKIAWFGKFSKSAVSS
jgi:hypothetical protein